MCTCVRVCVYMCVWAGVRAWILQRRLIPLALKPIISVIPPKTVRFLMLTTDCADASTVQLGR